MPADFIRSTCSFGAVHPRLGTGCRQASDLLRRNMIEMIEAVVAEPQREAGGNGASSGDYLTGYVRVREPMPY